MDVLFPSLAVMLILFIFSIIYLYTCQKSIKKEKERNKKLLKEIENIFKDFKNLENKVTNLNELKYKVSGLEKSNAYLKDKVSILEEKNEFEISFILELEKIKDIKLNLTKEQTELRTDFLLLLLSTKFKNNIFFIRINIFRKIVNSILTYIINKNRNCLRRTSPIFIDKLKPEDNKNKFFLIYSKQDISGVSKNIVNILIDFLMFIHDYCSSKIHLNHIENLPEVMKKINKEDNISTNTSFNSDDLIDYVFVPFDLGKDFKEMINTVYEEEEKIIISKNNNENENEKIKNNNEEINEKIHIKEIKKINNEEKVEKRDKSENNNINLNDSIDNEYLINQIKEDKIKKGDIKDGRHGVEKDEQDNEKFNKNLNDNKIIITQNEDIIKFDNIINRQENDNEKIKVNNFNNFINYLTLEQNLEEEDIKYIKDIYKKRTNNKFYIKDYIKLINNNNKDIQTINNEINFYKKKIDNYNIKSVDEYSIEYILLKYKENFVINSEIYKGIDCREHFRFNKLYKKIIDVNIVKEIEIEVIRDSLKKLTNKNIINILLEDKGKFGNDLDKEEIK